MTLKIPVGDSPLSIQQRITAGNDFDGTAPVAAGLTFANGTNKFAAGATGGLFNFEQDRPICLLQYLLDFGSPVDYTINIVTLDSPDETLLIEEANAQRVVVSPQMLLLAPGQALQVVTQGGTAAMLGRVSARNWR